MQIFMHKSVHLMHSLSFLLRFLIIYTYVNIYVPRLKSLQQVIKTIYRRVVVHLVIFIKALYTVRSSFKKNLSFNIFYFNYKL